MSVTLFLAGQAFVIVTALIGTYVKIAVRLREIEMHIKHGEDLSQVNHDDLVTLKSEVNAIKVKLEHLQTMQQMLCATCPLKSAAHGLDIDSNK